MVSFDNHKNVLSQFLKLWDDDNYLAEQCELHSARLVRFYGEHKAGTPKKRYKLVSEDYNTFRINFLKGIRDGRFDTLFIPLEGKPTPTPAEHALKRKLNHRQYGTTLFRVYALELFPKKLIITGLGFKPVKEMNKIRELQEELNTMNRVLKTLRNTSLTTNDLNSDLLTYQYEEL